MFFVILVALSSLAQAKEKEEFTEPLEFSAPENKDLDDGTDVASTFTTETPNFEKRPLHLEEEPLQEAAPLAGEAAAIPLSNAESFMFSTFGQDANIYELPDADSSAIVQDSNGVFSIVDDVQTGSVVQDNSFKRLVDSVLNNA